MVVFCDQCHLGTISRRSSGRRGCTWLIALARHCQTLTLCRIIHRVDYHRILLDEAIRLGAVLQLGAEVENIYTEQPAVLLAGGRRISADIVIGADGTFIDLLSNIYLTISTDKERSNVYGPKGYS